MTLTQRFAMFFVCGISIIRTRKDWDLLFVFIYQMAELCQFMLVNCVTQPLRLNKAMWLKLECT
jgi:hypothetical protein